MKFHCMFEQSGTFKNELKKLGYSAFDYDILNDFKETDFVLDLFKEIENAYLGNVSIFDNIKCEDVILAFFPCTRFENQIYMHFQGNAKQMKNWSDIEKLENNIKLHNDLNYLYCLISKLVIVCLKRSIKLVIENPYSELHYLTRYWCLKPEIIDLDRSLRGDYYKKPTQYWFINFKPCYNFVFEGVDIKLKKNISHVGNKVARSLISSDYANRFIREFLVNE